MFQGSGKKAGNFRIYALPRRLFPAVILTVSASAEIYICIKNDGSPKDTGPREREKKNENGKVWM